jgi:hypothetical protein
LDGRGRPDRLRGHLGVDAGGLMWGEPADRDGGGLGDCRARPKRVHTTAKAAPRLALIQSRDRRINFRANGDARVFR